MAYSFSELINVAVLQELAYNLYKIARIPIGIIDVNGLLLVSAGYQPLCAKFHRVHPETLLKCQESDNYIKNHIHDGGYIEYKCLNNLWDIAVPIVVEEEHVATLFLGQFFYDEAERDLELFDCQALHYDFNRDTYLEALKAVPVFSRQKVIDIMEYYLAYVKMIVDMGLSVIRTKQLNEKVQMAESYFKTTFENAPVGVCNVNLKGELVSANQAFCQMTGYKLDQIKNASCYDLIHSDDSHSLEDSMSYLLEGRVKTITIQKRLVRKNGTVMWVNHTQSLLRDVLGNPVFFIGVIQDITESKLLEKNFEREKKLLETTLMSVGDGVISTDQNGNVVLINKVAEFLTGWKQVEAKSKSIQEVYNVYNSLTHEKAEDIIKKVIETGKPHELDDHTVLISKNGAQRHVQNSVSPIVQQNGEILGVVVVFRDFTEKRKRLDEIEFMSYHDQLTGLFNRRFYEEELNRLDTSRNLPLTLVMADVNGLKRVNDFFGHLMGDELLKKVAKVIGKGCRVDDIVARLGGDEFVIILPQTDENEAEKFVKRIMDLSINEKIGEDSISISFGYDTKHKVEENIHDIFIRAENRMYSNKIKTGSSKRRRKVPQ